MMRALVRAYAVALHAFPEDFRARFGPQMVEAFERHSSRGVLPALHAIGETVMQGLGERVVRWRRRRQLGRSHSGGPGVGVSWLFKDVRFALRSYRRTPIFTLTALVVLALGIGSTTAVFSLINAVVLRGLPFPEPDQLVGIVETYQPANGGLERRSVSYPDYLDWKAGTTAFSDVGIRDFENVTYARPGGVPILLGAAFISPSYFRMLGVTPVAGRLLIDEDDAVGNLVAVLSHSAWATKFGADSAVMGKTVILNDVSVVVAGVADPEFTGTFGGVDLWMPFLAEGALIPTRPLERVQRRGLRGFFAMGRLHAGATIERAQREIDLVTADLHARGVLSPDRAALVVSFEEEYLGTARETAFILGAAVFLVLLIACANVANLLIARQLGRGKEIALRQAMGASRGVLARQLLVEALTLGAAGGLLGFLTALLLADALSATSIGNVPGYITPEINTNALWFAIGVSFGTGVVFGLLPAVGATRVAISDALKAGSRSLVGGAGGLATRRALVAGQVAVAVPLLVGAGLMIKSISNTLAVDTGFEQSGIGVAEIALPAARYDRAARAAFAMRLQTALEEQRVVQRAAVASDLPLNRGYSALQVEFGDAELAGEDYRVYVHRVSPGYFETLGIDVVQGRSFEPSDDADAPRVVIVSAQMAQRFWPNRDPLGRTVDDAMVVGVVANATYRGLTPDPENNPDDPDMFLPFAQAPSPRLQVGVRGLADAATLTQLIRAEVGRLDYGLPVYGTTSMQEIVESQVAANRIATRQLGVFAAIGLTLAAAGLFGVMAYTVARQTNEIGVRMALGADRTQVLKAFMGQGLGIVALGLVVGLTAAAGTARFLQGQLYDVGTLDAATYLVVAAAFVVTGVTACALPAWRAARVDPVVSLRSE